MCVHQVERRISEAHKPDVPSSGPLTRMHIHILTENFDCCVVSRKYSLVAVRSFVSALILGASKSFLFYVSVAFCSV